MSRDIPAQLLGNLSDNVVHPFFAIELNFDSGPLRLWTGVGTLTYDEQDYVGTGTLLAISSIEETSEIAVRGATLTLSGVPSEVISLALTSPYQGRVCNIYFGTKDKTLNTVSLTSVFSGYMDQMNISEGQDTSTIELQVENKLIDLERARVARFTSSYQKSVYPQDLGLDFVESLQDKDIVWGRSGGSGEQVQSAPRTLPSRF
jgi:hypothetical protein